MLDYASVQDIPALKAIWKACFKDTESYIDTYFNELFSHIKLPVCRRADGRPVSMLSMLPVTLKSGETACRGHYIYAAATAPGEEQRGYMSALLDFACREAEKAGDAFSCLLPAGGQLVQFYQKRGYHPLFFRKRVRFMPNTAERKGRRPVLLPLAQSAFYEARTRFLNAMETALLQDACLYPYLYREFLDSGGEILNAKWGETSGYLLCQPEADILLVKETSFSEQDLFLLADELSKRYGCQKIEAMLPARKEDEDTVPYGMIRFLQKELPFGGPGYMGLLMD